MTSETKSGSALGDAVDEQDEDGTAGCLVSLVKNGGRLACEPSARQELGEADGGVIRCLVGFPGLSGQSNRSWLSGGAHRAVVGGGTEDERCSERTVSLKAGTGPRGGPGHRRAIRRLTNLAGTAGRSCRRCWMVGAWADGP